MPHRRRNNAILALSLANLTWTKIEIMLTLSLNSAPFGGSAHVHKLRSASEEFFENNSFGGEIFQLFYPKLAFQLYSGCLPANFGTQEHQAMVWELVRSAWILRRKDIRAKAARWMQVFTVSRPREPYWAVVEMVLFYSGLHEGYVTRGDEPYPSAVPVDENDAPHVGTKNMSTVSKAALASGDPGVERTGVARSNSCKNYCHMAYLIYKNCSLRAIWILISRSVDAIIIEHNRTIMEHTTLLGCNEFAIRMSQ